MGNILRLKVKGWFKKLLPWLFILIATVGYPKDVTLSWDASPTTSVTGYTLYWDTQPNPPFNVSLDVGGILTHHVANLNDNEDYWFYVTANDGTNESVPSNIVKSPAIQLLPELDLIIEWRILD